jgi:chromo domain-containing protein 1
MTERTVANKTRAALDDDAISITSSQSERYTSDQEFLVERILAERREADENGKAYYLILWAGYPEEKATWEPKKNIQDPDILKTWKRRKHQEAQGTRPAFDLASFNARVAQMARAKADRQRRRKAKRKRLGLQVSPSESSRPSSGHEKPHHAIDSDSSEAMEVDEEPEDDPGMRRKANVHSRKPLVIDLEASSDIEPAPRRRTGKQQDLQGG